MNLSYPLAADFELWARFFKHADLVRVVTPLAGFRMHGGQKTDVAGAQYVEDADKVLVAHGGKPCGAAAQFLRRRIVPHLPQRARRILQWRGAMPNYYRVCQYHAREGEWHLHQVSE